MSPTNPADNRRLIIATAIGVGLFIGLAAFWRSWSASSDSAANTNNDVRERYQVLYEAAWRQDQGQGNILMTATLLLPPTISALSADSQRSDIEDQMYRLVDNLSANQTAIYVTTDSIIGPLADDAIKSSLELSATDGQAWTLVSWSSTNRLNQVGDSNVAVTPQAGVAVWQAPQDIDWASIDQLQLVSRGLGDQAERVFTWTKPALLMLIEP